MRIVKRKIVIKKKIYIHIELHIQKKYQVFIFKKTLLQVKLKVIEKKIKNIVLMN